MQLPISFVFEPPTRADLRDAARNPRLWVLAAALCLLVAGAIILARAQRAARELPADAALTVTSTPAGAAVVIDGRERGSTPAALALPRGHHWVTLRLARYGDVSYEVDLAPDRPATLDGILWTPTPLVQRLRSPLPGAAIADARFLADGRLALILALPGRDERQLWLVDRGGDARLFGPPGARLALTIARDGDRVAYLARGTAPASGTPTIDPTGAPRLDEVWVAGLDGERGERRYALPPNTADERLVDLSWSPDGGHLLLVSQQRPQGGTLRTRLLRLDTGTGEARELIALPGEVVPASYEWSPAGDRVALLIRAASRTTLCLVGTADGSFRALAEAGSTPFPPLAWSPRGDRLAYSAQPDAPTADPSGNSALVAIHTDDLDGG
ncbi:MAG TPA: PEGA domain-containing protein, partial [Nitrolancea sp.]|nr:PEGA domain-containing protein [Nitrolancea sp.]